MSEKVCSCGMPILTCVVCPDKPSPDTDRGFDERAAKLAFLNDDDVFDYSNDKECFISGARWQFERDREKLERYERAINRICDIKAPEGKPQGPFDYEAIFCIAYEALKEGGERG